MRELDEAWIRRDRYTRKEVFQVVWEYVSGIARKWNGFSFPRKEVWMKESWEKEGTGEWEYVLMSTRHEKCRNPKSKTGKSTLYLSRIPSVVREQKLYNRNVYVRFTKEIRFRSDPF